MNLIFRMLWVWLGSLRRERLAVGVAESRMRMITLPNDLDFNLHMTNGRYLTIADLSRIDLFLRTGLAKVMIKEKWAPLLARKWHPSITSPLPAGLRPGCVSIVSAGRYFVHGERSRCVCTGQS